VSTLLITSAAAHTRLRLS